MVELEWSNGSFALLDVDQMEVHTKTTFHYIWQIITVENLIFGIVLIYMSFRADLTKVKIAAWMIAVILVARWIVILWTTLYFKQDANILLDTVAIMLVVALILLGTRVKDQAVSNK